MCIACAQRSPPTIRSIPCESHSVDGHSLCGVWLPRGCAPASVGYEAKDASADSQGLPAPDAGVPSGAVDDYGALGRWSSDNLAEVKIDLQRVAILSDTGQEIELSKPEAIVDLLKLQGGVERDGRQPKRLVGHYSQLRLELEIATT